MNASRPSFILAGAAAIAFATVMVASPASAAVLPEGQKITVVEYFETLLSPEAYSQQWNVSPLDASGTLVGGQHNGITVYSIDVDDDGHGYATGFVFDDESGESQLFVADANTGAFTAPVPIDVPEVDGAFCPGIDYSSGTVFVSCQWEGESDFFSFIGTFDVASGVYTPFITLGDDEGEEAYEFYALATDPTTGQLWTLFQDSFGDAYATTVDVEAGELGESVFLTRTVNGADFDRNGQLFITYEDDAETLGTLDLDSGAISPIAPYPFVTSVLTSVNPLTVWGKPALAATGSSESELVLPVTLGSALLLLAGAAFVATARVNRSRTA